MSDTNSPPTLIFVDRFPVEEKRFELMFSNDQISDLNQTAADVLCSIISLEQMSYENVEPETKGISSDIHRLEQKVDFVTELLVKVIQSQQKRPPKKIIKMSAENIIFSPELSLNSGDYCVLSIYLSQKYPAPLKLPVKILKSHSGGQAVGMIEARILLSDENVIDDLTRMIFLFHRKQIARNKAQS